MNKTWISLWTLAIASVAIVGARQAPRTAQPKIYTEADLQKRITEVKKEADAKIAQIQKAADDKVAEAEANAQKRVEEVGKAAEEKMKKMLADSATADLCPFISEQSKWYQVENSDGAMRYRDPIWNSSSPDHFGVELDIQNPNLGSKSDTYADSDASFFVQVYGKDKKPWRRCTVYLSDITAQGGRFSLNVPLSFENAAYFSIRYNGQLAKR